MGWFSWFRKKVVKPVVEKVVTVAETVVEKVVTPIVEVTVAAVETVVTAIVPPIIDAVQSGFDKAKDYVATQVEKLAFTVIDSVTDVAFQTLIKIWDTAVDLINPFTGTDYSEFEVVGEAKQHEQFDTNNISIAEEVALRDAIVSAQVGHADFDVFRSANAIDDNGKVLDQDKFFEVGDWYAPLEDWASARFEVIRIAEANSDFFIPTYESNVALMKNIVTDTYFISVGGTVGLADFVTDLNLIAEGSTGDSVAAISNIIASFYEYDDIPKGASVVLSGMSLGGAEVVQQYKADPDAFDHVYAITSAGLGGVKGTYYENEVWKNGIGDAKITELNGDDPGSDFNDLVTSLGHIGAGQTYFVDEIIQAPGDIPFTAQIEAGDSHNLGNIFASLPSGANPDIPLSDPNDDVFMLA